MVVKSDTTQYKTLVINDKMMECDYVQKLASLVT